MDTQKHTRGPWLWLREEGREQTVVYAGSVGEGEGIALVEREPNARLIAAAPELYAALETATRVMVNIDPAQGENWRKYAVAIDTARAALAKADGR
jgi:hypothetical protein